MALLRVTTNIEQELKKLGDRAALLTSRNVSYMTARAMTQSAQAAQAELRAQMPRYIQGGPVPFTLNSTFVRFARPSNLSVTIGFREFASKGTAAGRYLNYMAEGGGRVHKSTERQLVRAGLIRSNQYLVPTGRAPLTLNSHGNLTGGTYTQMLSRLKALGQQGYLGNVSSSRRSQRKRQDRDYFIGRPGGRLLGVYLRVGPGGPRGGAPRGFDTMFYITRQPQYRMTFPIQQIIEDAYLEAWPGLFRAAFEAEIGRRFAGRL